MRSDDQRTNVALLTIGCILMAIAGLVNSCALRDLATPPTPLYPPCADSAATRDSTGACVGRGR